MAEAKRPTITSAEDAIHGRAEEVAELLKLLGNPQRLLIACLLCEGDCAVGEIEEKLGIRQPNLSAHIGVLREAGVVQGHRESKSVIYRLADERIRHLLDSLQRIFCPDGVAAFVAEPSQATPGRVASTWGAAVFARVP
jgi:DNA-binding transcriptional ArsR family regulator